MAASFSWGTLQSLVMMLLIPLTTWMSRSHMVTSILKVQLYRDELVPLWTSVASSPIKQVIAMAPKLRKCTNLKCDFKCGLYHLAVEESFEQVIHEIWGRRFPTLEGQIKSADSAEIFQAFCELRLLFSLNCSNVWSGLKLLDPPIQSTLPSGSQGPIVKWPTTS